MSREVPHQSDKVPSGESTGARIEETYHFTAPAEVVFGVLTDPHRTSRWLPRGFTAEADDPEQVRVRGGSEVHEFQVETISDRMQVRWRALNGSGADGSVRVEDAPAGGSRVRAEIDGPPAAESRLRELLEETMFHLQRDVSDNFNAG